MAEYPALPLWTDAYIADTMHMGCLASGAYLHLLMAAWRSPACSVSDDDTMLGRMARCTPREWSKVRQVVMNFWDHDEKTKTWSQKRLLKEREYVRDRSDRAKRAAETKHQKDKDTAPANASPEQVPDVPSGTCPTPAETLHPYPHPVKEDAVLSAGANVSREISEAEKNEVRKICEAFNDELKTIFTSRAPINPNGSNGVYALRMVRAGATVDLIRPLIVAALTNKAANGRAPILSLNYFDAPVMDALAALKSDLPKGNPHVQQRRGFDPQQQRQSDRSDIASALALRVDPDVVAGVRGGAVPDSSAEGDTGPAAGHVGRTETLSPSEYRVLRGADGPADNVRADVQPAEPGCEDGDDALPRDAEGFARRPAGESDLGNNQGSQEPVCLAAAGGDSGQGGRHVPVAAEALSQAGNGATGARKITDDQLVAECPAFLRRRA